MHNAGMRDGLMLATMEAVGQHGYAGATIARITELAGVAQSTFYLYFPSRQALFDELPPFMANRAADHLRHETLRERNFFTREGHAFRSVFAYLTENSWLYRVLGEAERRAPSRPGSPGPCQLPPRAPTGDPTWRACPLKPLPRCRRFWATDSPPGRPITTTMPETKRTTRRSRPWSGPLTTEEVAEVARICIADKVQAEVAAINAAWWKRRCRSRAPAPDSMASASASASILSPNMARRWR